MIQAEERKAFIQSERFSNFNRVVKTVAYVQRALSKYKPATFVVCADEIGKVKTIIFKILQRDQFGEVMNSLKAEKENPKSNKISLPLWRGTYSSQRQNRQQLVGLQSKASIFATLETSCG